MPSAEDTTYLFKVMPETTQDFLTHDVDILVSQIKENLRLTGLKAKSTVSKRSRPSPYLVNSKTKFERYRAHCVNNNNDNDDKDTEDDPYEKLRELLKQGRLINEAVKKLQTMNCNDLSNSNSEIEDEDDNENEDNNDVHHHHQRCLHNRHHLGYRRKTYYYDSEDEPLPEVYQPLDL
ncbi:hypothetical protein PV325_006966 [Microctonus aethiopoides]|uniref:Uncharacterized protein n=1 Tax=Microctonus aethiopoides TaxID=144406 RepID=A0AA39FZ54_9HYME|nr:hypothetical protein PV326_012033 [Microctonus aethiopoides]KAK0075383.1 hypothetical protein PV325_006966 [Microctonus aethiopoides]KAK0178186.1 hypothetical protein PV328_002160 [Microctonus aethiopoides]